MENDEWVSFVQATSSRLYRTLKGRGLGLHDAMDLGQEAYRLLIEHYGGETDVNWMASRLFLIADRLCIARWRRLERREVSLEAAPEVRSNAPGPEAEAERRETEQALTEALARLGEPARSILCESAQAEQRSDAELAESFSLSVANVRQIRHRALLRLTKMLRGQGDEGGSR